MSATLTQKLIKVGKSLNTRFTLHSKPLAWEEIFSDTGLLPAIARRADQLCSLCLGYGLGVSFDQAEGTVLGIKAKFDESTPSTLRVLCIIDVLQEIIKNSRSPGDVSLDELMYD